MTDPTKQAASAKTAREVIAEAVNVMAAATAWNWSDRTLEEVASDQFVSEPRPSELRLHAHAEAKAALALRALLDAPEGGGVQRLCEAAEGYFRAVTGREVAEAADDFLTLRLPSETRDFLAAIVALRASPESVGGAGRPAAQGGDYPDGLCTGCADIWLTGARKIIEERDAAKKALAEARANHLRDKRDAALDAACLASLRAHLHSDLTVEAPTLPQCVAKVLAERDAAKKDAAEWKASLDMYAKAWRRELGGWFRAKTHEIDALVVSTEALRKAYEAAQKDIERRDQEIIGLKVERHNALKARGDTAKPVPAYAAADLTQIARMDRIEARVAALEAAKGGA